MLELKDWELKFRKKLIDSESNFDPAHDLSHFERVVRTAKALAAKEKALLEVVVPAAWLHDLVNVPKDHPDRKKASQLSAIEAARYLKEENYPGQWIVGIQHAIEAHSFSAKIDAVTLEAKIVQDADRLEALGAIGIARCFSVGGQLQREFYESGDPFARNRTPDDQVYTLDHFFVKLLKLSDSFQTDAGRSEARRRTRWMELFLEELNKEIEGNPEE